jgi:adenylate cyclase class 2
MEVEAKILEINVDEVRKKLEELGAKLVYDKLQIVRILDFEDCRIGKDGNLLRIRKIGDKVELTFKGPKQKTGNVKTREEIETHVEDFEKALKIFEQIGLTPIRSYEKHRISYKLGNITFEIDKFPNLPVPPFLEIEAPTQKEVEEMVEKLGFKKEDMKSYGGMELMKHYNINIKDIR